jgi:hypothetical protein
MLYVLAFSVAKRGCRNNASSNRESYRTAQPMQSNAQEADETMVVCGENEVEGWVGDDDMKGD